MTIEETFKIAIKTFKNNVNKYLKEYTETYYPDNVIDPPEVSDPEMWEDFPEEDENANR